MSRAQPVLCFLGGTETVTGSRFLVETRDARVLVEAGLFQGLKQLRLRNRTPFPVDPSTIDAVVVTHAHLDHIGYTAALVANGFRGRIYLTRRTAELGAIVLSDAARLQEEEAHYANAHGFSKHRPATPLYTEADAAATVECFRAVAFDAGIDIAPGVRATFRRAGHILGSAGALIEIDDTPPRTLFVSGDVGRLDHPLLLPPEPPPAARTMLVESTYGDRRHDAPEPTLAAFASAITRTAGRGGTVVIPAFAVDRTELVLLALRDLMAAKKIPALPVYADSPMALSVLEVYRDALRAGDADIRPGERHADPFDLPMLREARTRDESIAINALHGPSIVISSSGMATGGRVLHHLARVLPDPRNSVILVGYQAAGTRGRLLANHAPTVKMLGAYVPVRSEIVVVDAFSAHADSDELTKWLASAPSEPHVAYVVHGEEDASESLRTRVERELGWTTVVPHNGERVRMT